MKFQGANDNYLSKRKAPLQKKLRVSQVALVKKKKKKKSSAANAGDTRDMDLIPVAGGSPGGGHGNALNHSCLENPVDRGAWGAIVHRVTQNVT